MMQKVSKFVSGLRVLEIEPALGPARQALYYPPGKGSFALRNNDSSILLWNHLANKTEKTFLLTLPIPAA